MNIQFGVSTWLWTSPFSTESASLFRKVAEMGFTHVEIPIEDPSLIDGKRIKDALDDHNLLPVACGAFGPGRDLTHEDPKVHRQCFDYLEQCFELCAAWSVSFLAGPMYSAVGKARLLPPGKRRDEWKLAVDNLSKVCEMASKYELQIALEPLNRFESDLVNTAADVRKMVDEIDHEAAAILLDSFHMTIEERDLEDAIRTAGESLIHVQVSENYRGAPGSGQTRWGDIRSGLEAINYQGVISIESFTPKVQELAGAVCIWRPFAQNQDDFAREGLAFLTEFFK